MRTRRRFSAEFKAKVALEAIKGHYVSAERASRGYERAAGSYGGLPLRRVLRGDGNQARGAGPTRQGVGASHLCVRRVWP